MTVSLLTQAIALLKKFPRSLISKFRRENAEVAREALVPSIKLVLVGYLLDNWSCTDLLQKYEEYGRCDHGDHGPPVRSQNNTD